MFTYIIKEVHSHQITVHYEDGSVAEVPVYDGESKETIEERISQFYHPTTTGFRTTSVVPFSVDEVGSTEEWDHSNLLSETNVELPEQPEQVLTYRDMRQLNYPTIQVQLMAMHEARQGITSSLDAVDAEIISVNTIFNENMPDMTETEYAEFLEGLSEL